MVKALSREDGSMMKKAVVLGLKILLLTILMVASLAVSSAIVSIHTSQSESNSLILIFLYALINTGILTIFIVNARPRGIKLIGITFMIFWGIQFFMTQIETLYFNASVKMPIVDVLEVVISGALTAVIFSSLAVLILGKFKKKDASHHHESLFKGLISKSWLHILSLSVSYVIIYFLFGYFIAWQFPDLRYYYTGSKDILNIFQHLSNQFRTDPILPLFQLFRGLLWSGLSIIMEKKTR